MSSRFSTLGILGALLLSALAVPAAAQDGGAATGADSIIDTGSRLILDHMVEMIGSLTSVNYTVRTKHDVVDPDYGTITRFGTSQVYMTGPDQMQVNTVNDVRHVGYWYDGAQVTYYSFTENNYGQMDAPDNIMATIEQIHAEYGVDFPAADFFYPSFTDDLAAQSTRISYLGTVQMEGRECFRIVAQGKDQTVQLWIANDATFLPVKFIITDHTNANAQYEGTFADWVLNPDIPPTVYQFTPPPGATPLYILPRTPTTGSGD